MNYKEIEGDLISLAFEGHFDVIAHGCNCHCVMGAGIAPQMAKAFGADKYAMEGEQFAGMVNKLGMIDFECRFITPGDNIARFHATQREGETILVIVNAYTQYNFGINHYDGVHRPADYDALRLCFKKINKEFAGKRIGLPKIGAGLAGGNWEQIKSDIQTYLCDCDVTVVIYKPKENE